MVKDHSDSERGNLLPHGLLFPISTKGSFIYIIPDRITHTTAFVKPVVEHWLEREITRGNQQLPLHVLLFPISRKGSFICTPYRQDSIYHRLCYLSESVMVHWLEWEITWWVLGLGTKPIISHWTVHSDWETYLRVHIHLNFGPICSGLTQWLSPNYIKKPQPTEQRCFVNAYLMGMM